MNASKVLFGGASAVADLSAHGGAHGRSNIDKGVRHAAFNGGIMHKYLNLFPRHLRTPIGATTAVCVGALTFITLKPAKKPGRVFRTLNSKWEKQTAELVLSQRPSLAHKKSG